MKRRILWAFAAAIAGLTVFGTADAQQQQTPPAATFQLSSSNPSSPILALNNGEGNCSVQVDVISGATLIPQITSEPAATALSPWSTATLVGAGSINAAGTQSGPISQSNPAGLSGFRLILSGNTGTASGKIICTRAQGPTTATISGGTVTVANPAPTGCGTGGIAICVGGNQGTNNNNLQMQLAGPLGTLILDPHATGTLGTNAITVMSVISPLDPGGVLSLISSGCSKMTTAAGGATTVISAVPAHLCGYQITTALTVMQFGIWNNASALSGTQALASAVGAGIATVTVPGGKVWMTVGITAGSAATGTGAATVFWDT